MKTQTIQSLLYPIKTPTMWILIMTSMVIMIKEVIPSGRRLNQITGLSISHNRKKFLLRHLMNTLMLFKTRLLVNKKFFTKTVLTIKVLREFSNFSSPIV